MFHRPISEFKMNRPSRLKLSDVNPNLICVLCGGYFIDATTIAECLHSFCKTCIVRYLETSKYCPICDVQVHKTKPLQNIRADHTLQNIVYKLVPGLYQNEMKQRQEFYARHPEVPPVSEYDAGVINEETSCIYSPDETVALCLEYSGKTLCSLPFDATENLFSPVSKDYHPHRRYFRCPAAVTVSHLKKLLRSKYGISVDHRVDIMYNDELLKEEYSLMDVAYIYLWKRKGFMRFTYRIFERHHKRRRLDLERCKTEPSFAMDASKSEHLGNVSEIKAVVDGKREGDRLIHDQIPLVPESELKDKASEMTAAKCDTSVGEDWKEVQLQISENGIMSVRNMDDLVSAVEGGMLSGAFNETIISSGKAEESSGELGKSEMDSTVPAEKDCSKLPGKMKEMSANSIETKGDSQCPPEKKSVHSEDSVAKPLPVVEKKEAISPSAPTLPTKTNAADRMSGQRSCSSVRYSFPKKEVSLKPKDTNSKEIDGEVGTSVPAMECLPSSHSPVACAPVAMSTVTPSVSITPIPPSVAAPNISSAPTIPKRSNSAPVGYKTLKTPPKTWNPSIPRAKVLANHSAFGKSGVGNINGSIGVPGQSMQAPSKVEVRTDGKVNSTSSAEGVGVGGGVRLPPTSSPKPLRFFKMRNNMPRYLGNPSSGVKPMYSMHPGTGGGVAPVPQVVSKPPSPSTKDPKANTVPPPLLLPTSSAESKTMDKSKAVATKVAFPVTPTPRSGHKPTSGAMSLTMASAGHHPSPPTTLLPMATSHAQLPASRTTSTTTLTPVAPSQGMPPSLATPSPGYHPSLPPSISIFGQARPPTSQTPPPTPPPAVQRVPASVHHHFHHPVTPIHLLQHRQAAKAPTKLNGELNNGNVGDTAKPLSKGEKPPEGPAALPIVTSPPSEALKAKEGPSREVAMKEPINGKIEGSGGPAKTPPPAVVEAKSIAPSKC